MSWNSFYVKLALWLLVAGVISFLAYLQFRYASVRGFFDILFMAVGIIASIWVLMLFIRFMLICFQNNFILTAIVILALIYLSVRYKIVNNNPNLNGYIQKFQEFQEKYNDKMDELDRIMKKGYVTPEAGSTTNNPQLDF